MRTLIAIALGCAGLFTSCYKDDIAPEALTTNPLDPDYDGPPVVQLDSATTDPFFNPDTQQMEYLLMQFIHVRTDLLPEGVDYTLHITKLNTGEVYDYSSDIPPGSPTYYSVTPGEQYCYAYRLKVGYALTKADTYCTTAEP